MYPTAMWRAAYIFCVLKVSISANHSLDAGVLRLECKWITVIIYLSVVWFDNESHVWGSGDDHNVLSDAYTVSTESWDQLACTYCR